MPLKLLQALTLLTLLISCFACGDDTRDIRDYYYPVRELTDGLVYEYRDLNLPQLTPDYWYYRALPTDTAYYFTKAHYQNDFQPRTLYREEMVTNGILIRDLFLFETDSTGQQQQVQAEVMSANVFPFQVRDSSEIFIYQVRFQLPSQPNGSTTFLLNRRFVGDTTYQYQDKTYDAIQFTTRGSIDQRDTIQGAIEPQFSGREIYARGLGLVYYERDYGPEAPTFRHQLVARYPMSELEQKAERELR